MVVHKQQERLFSRAYPRENEEQKQKNQFFNQKQWKFLAFAILLQIKVFWSRNFSLAVMQQSKFSFPRTFLFPFTCIHPNYCITSFPRNGKTSVSFFFRSGKFTKKLKFFVEQSRFPLRFEANFHQPLAIRALLVHSHINFATLSSPIDRISPTSAHFLFILSAADLENFELLREENWKWKKISSNMRTEENENFRERQFSSTNTLKWFACSTEIFIEGNFTG